MQCRRQFVAWLMLGIILAIPAVTLHASSISAAPRSAGCHEHGGSAPSQPAGFACCERGHRAALPAGFSLQLPEADSDFASISGLQNFVQHDAIAVPPFAYSPPELTLRV